MEYGIEVAMETGNYRRSAKFENKKAESWFASSDEIAVGQLKTKCKKQKQMK